MSVHLLVKRVDDNLYELLEPHQYYWEKHGFMNRITVTKGFLFDGASIPSVARPFMGGCWALGFAPPLLHDFLYAWKGVLPYRVHEVLAKGGWSCALEPPNDLDFFPDSRAVWSRHDADRLFGRMMREANVPRWKRRAAYMAVRAAVWHGIGWGKQPQEDSWLP